MAYQALGGQQVVNQYGRPAHVGLNRFTMGSSRTVTWTSRFDIWARLFEPFVTREQGRYGRDANGNDTDIPFGEGGEQSQGSVLLGVRKVAVSAFLELCCSYLLVLFTVGTFAGAVKSGANIVVSLLVTGLVHGFGRYASVAAKMTPHLPRHLEPSLTWAEWWNGNVGAIIAILAYWIPQFGGALLATLTLCLGDLHQRDYWAGPSKFGGATGDLSCFGLWAIYTGALTVINFAYQYAQTFTSHRYPDSPQHDKSARLTGITAFVVTQFTGHFGIYSVNAIIALGGFVGNSTSTAVTGSALDWLIPVILSGVASGPLSALFSTLLWNTSIKNRAQMMDGYSRDTLAQEGGRGGAAHTPEGRHLVQPPQGASQVNARFSGTTSDRQSNMSQLLNWAAPKME